MNFLKKYIGTRSFYRTLLVLVVPLIIQQGITNFVSLLDNLMVGALGTYSMSAVSIVNQLIFVFNLAIFGGLSGASIFGTQFYGVSDWKGMRDTFRFKMMFSIVAAVLAMTIFTLFGDRLTMLFLHSEENTEAEILITLQEARSYLKVAIWGLIPFAVVQTYAGTLRETGETVIPMTGGIIAIAVNLVFNYLLIYGKFGFPAWGVRGAAVATVMSRYVELIYVAAATHRLHTKFRFIEGAYRSLHVPAALVKKIVIFGTPLLVNEILWSVGMTAINQNYSVRGIGVVAAMNITTTVWNLFCVIMFAMGSAISIMLGQKLGAKDREGAIDTKSKLIFLAFVVHIVIGLLLIASAPFIPKLYKVEPEVQAMATKCLMIAGAALPIHSVIHSIYFVIRSGGKTLITFLFDSVYTLAVPATLSMILCKHTQIDIITIYFIIQFVDVVKLFVGIPMVRSGFWANCLIDDETSSKKEKLAE